MTAQKASDANITKPVAYFFSLLCFCANAWHLAQMVSRFLLQTVLCIAKGAVTMTSVLWFSAQICSSVCSNSERAFTCRTVVKRGASFNCPKTACPTLTSTSVSLLVSATTSLIFLCPW